MRMSEEQGRRLDAYWRAAHNLTVCPTHLQGNPLPRGTLRAQHIKPRLPPPPGPSPGLRFLYAPPNPLEGAWKGISFLNPVRDGAVLPILHLNEYKIAGPTVLGRSDDAEISSLLGGHGYEPHFLEGDDPAVMHPWFAETLDACYTKIRAIRAEARRSGAASRRPRWPAIVLRTPKGWTGPKAVDGVPIEGTFRAHQVPLAMVKENAAHLKMLEAWMRSYRPEDLF